MVDTTSITGRPRKRHTAWVRANHPPICAMCGLPIDMRADQRHSPLASVVDEWIPRKHGGSAVDRDNAAHLHRYCNGVKGARVVTTEMRQRCRRHIASLLALRTRRTW